MTKRVAVFVDGQNLFYAAKDAFGYIYPNYDILKLSEVVCNKQSWQIVQVAFYTGVPSPLENEPGHQFWVAKLGSMGHQGIKVFSRPLRYRNKVIELPDGTASAIIVGQEKGVDVRLALDVVRSTYRQECDVVLIFSQDQDLSEVAKEVRLIAREQNRWLKIASVYPVSAATGNKRGIDKNRLDSDRPRHL